jgi:hypothetical protein
MKPIYIVLGACVVLAVIGFVWLNPNYFTAMKIRNKSAYSACLVDAIQAHEKRTERLIAIKSGSNPPLHKLLTAGLAESVSALYSFADTMGKGSFHEDAIRMLEASAPTENSYVPDMDACKRHLGRYK